MAWNDVLLVVILTICVTTDIRSRMIYNAVVFPALGVTVICQVLMGGWEGLLTLLAGFAVGFGILFIPYLMGGMGAGDVKLLALVGALMGPGFVLAAAVYMAPLGALLAVMVVLFRKGAFDRFRQLVYFVYGLRHGIRMPMAFGGAGAVTAVYPYGVAIAGGAAAALFAAKVGVGMRRDQRGQSLVEFALLVPLLLVLVCGIVDFGRIMYGYLHLNMIAQETVRLGGLGKTDAEMTSYAKSAIRLGSSTKLTVTITPGDTTRKSGVYVKVGLVYPIGYATPFIGKILPSPTVTAESSIRVE